MKKKRYLLSATAAGLALALGASVAPAVAGTTAWSNGALSCGGVYVALSAETAYTASYYRYSTLNATYYDQGTYKCHRNLKLTSITSATIVSDGTLPRIRNATATCAFS